MPPASWLSCLDPLTLFHAICAGVRMLMMSNEPADAAKRSKEIAHELLDLVRASVADDGDIGPSLMAISDCAGALLAASASSAGHLEEGLRMLADLTAEQARAQYLAQLEEAPSA